MPRFSHLHVHTQFSLLDGAADIRLLYQKALADQMPAIAITDHGNMFGVFQFVAEASFHRLNPDNPLDKRLKIKPIVGCELYVVENRFQKQFTKEDKDRRYHQVLLAKNEEGYRNLIKLCSLGFIEGMYGKYPRVDKDLIRQYHKGLIATTCCLAASVPRALLKRGREEGEKEFKWWLDLFGEDYYIEIQRHGIPEQEEVNPVLMEFSRKYGVKMIATNDSHYVDQKDSNAHDILLCINTGEKKSTPTIKEFADDDILVKNKRFAFYNDQFFFKTGQEMSRIFPDLPQAIDHTNEIVDKVEWLDLKKNILLPNFPIPAPFLTQDQYLRHLTWEGARKRYAEMNPELEERLRSELETVEKTGFAGYFLIVADFIRAGRELGVYVGPGRGSAAGSVTAYCLGITNIDPIKYNLLFERFLTPERKSMPDIDTDFDDEGRQKVINYVVEKYGRNQVAQIVTFGTMAAKMSIKDVARVLDLPLADSNALAKMVPERPGIELKRILHAPLSGESSLAEREGLGPDELENVRRLREIREGSDLKAEVMKEAEILEGSVRNTGVHAAGIIIAPQDLTDLIPVCTAKDSDLLLTQFEGGTIENAGVIKMDFLGLKTLSIIQNALTLIRQNHGQEIDIDSIPLDDPKTYGLFQRGETDGTFQFESPGMQKYLRDLRPDKFEDLIAMNALYRPGPLEYIPDFIKRKNGIEPVVYDLPAMEEILRETYGITVYQEQVMLLSQKLADFSKADADNLRKAMGKKQKAVLDKRKAQFIEGCSANGYPAGKCEKIWSDWESFAAYAFNKSHSTCYAYIAFQTAYLKAHYPAEYMASVLNYAGNIEKITFYMEECRRIGIPVLGPDINESEKGFAVNKQGEIRFGLAGLKGVGEAAVQGILDERDRQGVFPSIFDFAKRIPQRSVNKKCLESLAMSGAFDYFQNLHRAQYFFKSERDNLSGLERIIRFGNQFLAGNTRGGNSLFEAENLADIANPKIPSCDPWPLTVLLEKEKEVTGMYLSGHPLDNFRFELKHYHIVQIKELVGFMDALNSGNSPDLASARNRETQFRLAGFVSEAQADRHTRKGNKFGSFIIEDYSGKTEILLWSEDYAKYSQFVQQGFCLFVSGSVRPRNYRNDFEFKVHGIQLLEEVKKKQTKQVSLMASAEAINQELVVFLEKNANQYPGKSELFFHLVDPREGWQVNLRSFTRSIELNDDLTQFLEKRADIDVHINIFNN